MVGSVISVVAAALALAIHVDVARASACVMACKDEVAACVRTECAGSAKRVLRCAASRKPSAFWRI